MRRLRIRAFRLRLLALFAVTACWLTFASAASATGLAMPVAADATFKGWARVCPAGVNDCSSTSTGTATAYRWYPRYGWYGLRRPAWTRVWVVPYSGSWSWTWTATSGWTAMRSELLLTGTAYSMCAPGGPCSSGFTPVE